MKTRPIRKIIRVRRRRYNTAAAEMTHRANYSCAADRGNPIKKPRLHNNNCYYYNIERAICYHRVCARFIRF